MKYERSLLRRLSLWVSAQFFMQLAVPVADLDLRVTISGLQCPSQEVVVVGRQVDRQLKISQIFVIARKALIRLIQKLAPPLSDPIADTSLGVRRIMNGGNVLGHPGQVGGVAERVIELLGESSGQVLTGGKAG